MITQKQIDSLIKLVTSQGEVIKKSYQNRKNLDIEIKSDGMDFVTETDKKVEKNLSDGIFEIFPNSVILGEETGFSESDFSNKLLFVLDPIDGTKYFRHGMSLVTLSVGIQYNGKNIFGVILNPLSGDIIYGGKDFWVYDNFGKIEKNFPKNLAKTQIYFDTVGFSEQSVENQKKWLEFISKIFQNSYRARTAGASCLFAFGAVSGLFGAIIDIFGGVKITDRIGYSAILQGLDWEEREVFIGGMKNLWLGPTSILDELVSLL